MNIDPGTEPRPEGQNIAVVAGDGGPKLIVYRELEVFASELRLIQSQATKSVMSRRLINEECRFAVWDGQSDDGRKHASALGKDPFPWEGGADSRIRLADELVNTRMEICLAAEKRAVPRIIGQDLQGEAWGNHMNRLLRYETRNKMRATYRNELKKFLQYTHGDSPAGCMMGVYWHQETGLRMEHMTLEELAAVAVQKMQESGTAMSEQDEVQLLDLLRDENQEATAVALFRSYFPHVKAARARTAVRSLRETGEASVPMPYVRCNEPQIVAHRMYEDCFPPPNSAGHFQRWRYYHIREWMTEAEIREKPVSEGWTEDFTKEVLQHEGQTFFPEYYRARMNEVELRQASVEENVGYFEIIRTYFRAVNDDGIMGVYLLTWHHAVKHAAHERTLLDYPHGGYPGVYLAREVLNNRSLDSRGVPEMTMTDQTALKEFHDLTQDRATITTVPPIFVPMARPDLKLKVGPLSQIKRNRKEDYELMNFGTADDHDKAIARIEKRVAQYFGQPHADVPEALTAVRQQTYVDDFLDALVEIYWQIIQLCQVYLTEDELRAITGNKGQEPLFHGLEEVQGRFGLEVEVNMQDVVNQDYLLKKVEMIAGQILPLDTLNVIQRDKLINVLLRAVDPNLATDITLPVDVATQQELEDEDNNLAKIDAGMEPEMKTQGQNFSARLNRIKENLQKNPAMLQRIQSKPDCLAILQARIKSLTGQVQQQQNASTGRKMAKPALEQQPAGVGG